MIKPQNIRNNPLQMKALNISIVSALAVLTTLFAIWVSGCTQPTPAPDEDAVMLLISSGSSPRFSDDMTYDGLEHSLQKSLSYLQKIPVDWQFAFGNDRYTTGHMIRSLQYFMDFIQSRPPADKLKEFIRANYRVYRSVGRNDNGEVLYTGYYEPHLRGSLFRTATYRFPIYARPQDLISIDLGLFSKKFAGKKII